tara:strand:+ start:335 stop:1189 length:855 start_codon:yes stop_codon:yes gene_type:complete
MIGIREIIIIIIILLILFYKDIQEYYKVHDDINNHKDIHRGCTKKVNEVLNKEEIPQIIYKTGIDDYDKVPLEVIDVFNDTLDKNKGFKIMYYSDIDSLNFIKNNFNKRVLDAYMRLIPGAYKADLFRYCILYKKGGIYSDLTQRIMVPYKSIIDFSNDELYLVKDRPQVSTNNTYNEGIQISFIATRPGNDIFLQCIDGIIENIDKKYYGNTPLCPTGPQHFYNVLKQYKGKYKLDLRETGQTLVDKKNRVIIINKIDNHQTKILKNRTHYDVLWRKGEIYLD